MIEEKESSFMRPISLEASEVETRLPESTLIEYFKLLSTPDREQARDFLLKYFGVHPFHISCEALHKYVYVFYDESVVLQDESMLSRLLWTLLCNATNRNIVDDMINTGFVRQLCIVFPRFDAVHILICICNQSKKARMEMSSPEFISKLQSLLSTEEQSWNLQCYLSCLALISVEGDGEELVDVVRIVMSLLLNATDARIPRVALYCLGELIEKYYQLAAVFFSYPGIDALITNIVNGDQETIMYFLSFIETAFSNPWKADVDSQRNVPAIFSVISSEFVGQLLDICVRILQSDQEALIVRSARAFYRLLYHPSLVTRCLEIGLDERLFTLQDSSADFYSQQWIFQAICGLMSHADFESARHLIEHGFMERMQTWCSSMSGVIPHAILGALGQIVFLAELNGIEEWLSMVFEDETIGEMFTDLTNLGRNYVDPDDAIEGISVPEQADCIWVRREK